MKQSGLEHLLEGYREYRPAVMWFWNDDIQKQEIDFQLSAFSAQGIREFYVHPLFGMRQDYLSDEFFDLIRHTVSKAKELGMTYWIYDENNWPSGTAAGKLIKEHPEYRSTVLRKKSAPFKKGEPCRPACEKDAFFALQLACDGPEDVTARVTAEAQGDAVVFSYTGEADGVLDLYVAEYNLSQATAAAIWSPFCEKEFVLGYLDTGMEEAVKAFIGSTHERYRKAVGGEFGKTVRGVFTDEVTICLPMVGTDVSDTVPWTRDIGREFKELHGYEIGRAIPHLFSDGDGSTKRSRRDYWVALAALFTRNYMKQTADWCREHSLEYTGHFGGEEVLFWHLVEAGDIYGALSYFTMPGCDSILSKEYVNHYNFNIAAKLVSSAAYFQGKARVLCETYSGSGADCTLRDMKRVANRLLVLGVDYFQYMGAYYSLNNARKQLPLGYPPSHSYNNPLFAHYPALNDYIAKLSCFNAGTEPAASVMVLLPAATSQTLLGGGKMWNFLTDYPLMDVDLTFDGTVNALMNLNMPFIIGFDQTAARMDYDAVILPGLSALTPEIFDTLTRLIEEGKRIVFVNRVPDYCTDGRAISAAEAFGLNPAEGPVVPGKKNVLFMGCRDWELTRPDRDDASPDDGAFPNDRWTPPLYAPPSAFTNLMRQCLEGISPGGYRITAEGRIFSSLRRHGEEEYLLLVNDSEQSGAVAVNADGGFCAYDPDTGLTRRYGDEAVLDLHGYESRILTKAAGAVPEEAARAFQTIPLDGPCAFYAKEPNICLPEQYLKDPETGEYLKTEQCGALDRILPGQAYHAAYRFTAGALPGRVALLTERDDTLRWTVNGKNPGKYTVARVFSPDNRRFDITGLVKPGENVITVEGTMPDYEAPHLLPYAALTGDFRVAGSHITGEELPARPLPFDCLGYPNYSGTGVYRVVFHGAKWRKAVLVLDTDDAAAIVLNGVKLKTVCWPPYEIDLTEHLAEGQNTLEIEITSVMGNMFGVLKPSGLKSTPYLKVYQ